jgi:hypothetical protein
VGGWADLSLFLMLFSSAELNYTVIQRLEFQRITAQINSGSPEVELRFCPWLILFKY